MLTQPNPLARLAAAEAALAATQATYDALDAVGRFHYYGDLYRAQHAAREARAAACYPSAAPVPAYRAAKAA